MAALYRCVVYGIRTEHAISHSPGIPTNYYIIYVRPGTLLWIKWIWSVDLCGSQRHTIQRSIVSRLIRPVRLAVCVCERISISKSLHRMNWIDILTTKRNEKGFPRHNIMPIHRATQWQWRYGCEWMLVASDDTWRSANGFNGGINRTSIESQRRWMRILIPYSVRCEWYRDMDSWHVNANAKWKWQFAFEAAIVRRRIKRRTICDE